MSQNKITYPPGVRDLSEDISTDDLVRRLTECAQAFQNMSQDEDNTAYMPLALYLASETFLEHRSTDVRLLVACCIADVFRVYAPEAPYKDIDQLKMIFEFFVGQLKGLSNTQSPYFRRTYYLLENLAAVKTFNICFEFEENQKIISCLFKLMFQTINENHNNKVRKFMIDMLCPLITESDSLPEDLLDIIFKQIIEPLKTKKQIAYVLAQEILAKTAVTLEPYIQDFFNGALILGRTESDISGHLFDLIYELNIIVPSIMVMVIPQLECKLKSADEAERLQVTKAVAKMFADKKSNMIDQNKSLWNNFLLRFCDISPKVRLLCVQYCKQFFQNHPEAKDDITERFKQRIRDNDEEVRFSVISTIIEAAVNNFDSINSELLDFVKDRTLDKKFRVRKEAIVGLAKIYKKYVRTIASSGFDSISWIKNKVLHMYYQTSLEDKLLVERIIHTSFIPYQTPIKERMKLLYQLYCSIDQHAVKAFKEILRTQKGLRSQTKSLLEILQKEKTPNRVKSINNKVTSLSKNLPDPAKSKQHLAAFCNDLYDNVKMRTMLSELLNKSITCEQAESKVKEILKCLGNPVTAISYYSTIKQLLERIAPVMIDKESIKYLAYYVKDSLIGSCAIEAELGLENSAQLGLDLLLVLSYTFPHTFYEEETYNNLMLFLQTEYEYAADSTLQIFINIVSSLESSFPEMCRKLIPILENFIETGSSKQAKHAVYCVNNIVSDKQTIFGNMIDNLKKHLTLESQYFRTALISIGHIAFLNPNMFATDLKAIITKVIHDLLMLDQDFPRGGTDLWGPLDSLPDETKCKIEGMKLMVRWLAGLKDFCAPAASTLNLFTNVLLKDGELGDRGRGNNMAPVEKSWMRMSAASCILKLCYEPNYAPLVNLESFLLLASVINDACPEVGERFAKKLHKGLFFMKLPIQFLAIFSLAGFNKSKDFQDQMKRNLRSNINKWRLHLKENNISNEKLPLYLPDYSVSYAVWLLAHSKVLPTYDDLPGLRKIKECLKLLLDCLMARDENYSFPFFKRLLENIKQTKDKKSLPEESDTEEIKKRKEEMNLKMYAVCDLALNLVLSKPNHILKEFPAEPLLNKEFFTDPDKSYSNMKTYLPAELMNPLKVGFEVEMFDSSKTMNSTANEQTTINSINHTAIPSTSHNDTSAEELPVLEEDTNNFVKKGISNQRTMRSKSVIQHTRNSISITSPSQNEPQTESNLHSEDSQNTTPDENSHSGRMSKDSGVSSSSTKNSVVRSPRGRPRRNRPEPIPRSTRSSHTSTPSLSSNVENNLEASQQNGISSPSETSASSPSYQHLLRDCKVRLSKDDVENYSSSTQDSIVPSTRGRRKVAKVVVTTRTESNVDSSLSKDDVEIYSFSTEDSSVPSVRGKQKVTEVIAESPVESSSSKDDAETSSTSTKDTSVPSTRGRRKVAKMVAEAEAEPPVDISLNKDTAEIVSSPTKDSSVPSTRGKRKVTEAMTESSAESSFSKDDVETSSTSTKDTSVPSTRGRRKVAKVVAEAEAEPPVDISLSKDTAEIVSSPTKDSSVPSTRGKRKVTEAMAESSAESSSSKDDVETSSTSTKDTSVPSTRGRRKVAKVAAEAEPPLEISLNKDTAEIVSSPTKDSRVPNMRGKRKVTDENERMAESSVENSSIKNNAETYSTPTKDSSIPSTRGRRKVGKVVAEARSETPVEISKNKDDVKIVSSPTKDSSVPSMRGRGKVAKVVAEATMEPYVEISLNKDDGEIVSSPTKDSSVSSMRGRRKVAKVVAEASTEAPVEISLSKDDFEIVSSPIKDSSVSSTRGRRKVAKVVAEASTEAPVEISLSKDDVEIVSSPIKDSSVPSTRGRRNIAKSRTESPVESSPSNSSLVDRSEAKSKRSAVVLGNDVEENLGIAGPAKRKRNISVTTRSVRSKTDDSSVSKRSDSTVSKRSDSTVSKRSDSSVSESSNSAVSKTSNASKSPVKTPVKNGKPSKAIKPAQKSKLISNNTSSQNNLSGSSGDSKPQLRGNSLRNLKMSTRQMKNTEVKSTGRR